MNKVDRILAPIIVGLFVWAIFATPSFVEFWTGLAEGSVHVVKTLAEDGVWAFVYPV